MTTVSTDAMQRKVKSFLDYAYHRHDVVVNQKYDDKTFGDTIPYSFHLKAADAAYKQFSSLLTAAEKPIVRMAVAGHDLIEDARVTFNDLRTDWGEDVAKLIYACTELRGMDTDERHGQEYYDLLYKSEAAVFVKLCDMLANLRYSIMFNSTFFRKHKKYYSQMRLSCPSEIIKRFKVMFNYMQALIIAHDPASDIVLDSSGSMKDNKEEKVFPSEDKAEEVLEGTHQWDLKPRPELMDGK